MSDNTQKKLIVPVNLDAICIGNETVQSPLASPTAGFMTLHAMEFNFPKEDLHYQTPLIDDDSMVEVFGNSSRARKGVYLHWTFPAALLHGTQVFEINEAVLLDLQQQGLPDAINTGLKKLQGKQYSSQSEFRAAVSNTLTNDSGQVLWYQTIIEHSAASIKFPSLPNRWILARIEKGKKDPTCWVIESDYLSTENIYGDNDSDFFDSAQILSPYSREADFTAQKPFMRFMGRVRALDGDWLEDSAHDGEYYPNLTVAGYGAMSFSGYLPNCQNVFAFKDPLTDLTNIDSGTELSYLVVGWFSDPSKDPVTNAPTSELLEELLKNYHWTLPGDKGNTDKNSPLPQLDPSLLEGINGSVYTGFLKGVQWNPQHAYFENPKIDSSDVEVILANSNAEALAAYIGQGKPDIETLSAEEALQALQMGILPKVVQSTDKKGMVSEAIHSNSFSQESGGMIWQIDQINAASNNEASPGDSFYQNTQSKEQLPPLTDTIADALNQLNISQQEFDKRLAQVADRRLGLYHKWYWYNRWNYDLNLKEQKESQLLSQESNAKSLEADFVQIFRKPPWAEIFKKGLLSEVRKELPDLDNNLSYQEYQLAQGLQKINNGLATIQTALKADKLDKYYQLTLVPAARFWHPNDPVLMIVDKNGSISDKQKNKEGRGFLTQDKDAPPLFCRTSLQTLTPVSSNLDGLNGSSDKANSLSADQLSLINSLLREADALNQEDLSKLEPGKVGQKSKSGFAPARLGMCQWGEGTSETVNGVNRKNPWIPIQLQYEFNYYFPEEFENFSEDSIAKLLALDSDNIELKYISTAGGSMDYANYLGKVPLSHEANGTIKDQVDRLVSNQALKENNPIISTLAGWVENLDDTPVLSQAINGFYDNLLMQNRGLKLGIFDPYEEAPGSGDSLSTEVRHGVGKHQQTIPSTEDYFNPIQSGFIEIRAIRIVDAFGQYKEISRPDVVLPQELTPANRTLNAQTPLFKPKQDQFDWEKLFALPPRMASSTRLAFRWLSASHDNMEMNSHPVTSPICGWVVPNALDESLMIYNAAGIHLGALQSINNDNADVNWIPAPKDGPNSSIIYPDQITNPHLKAFVNGFLGTERAGPFNTFRSTVDRVLLSIEPSNSHQQESLAVLMGRPLALVQANLSLEQKGLPNADLSAASFLNFLNGKGLNSHNYESVQFPVRLGDLSQTSDGLVGYYDYSTAGAIHPEKFQAEDAAAPIYLSLSDTAPKRLLLLVDPRAKVHATTGILPIKSIEIPPDQYADAIKNMEFTFLVNPVLSPPDLVMPTPAETDTPWAWLTRDGKGNWKQATDQIREPDGTANHKYSTLQLLEGWLKSLPLSKNNKSK